MAKIAEIDQTAWAEWVATRPECVRVLCEKLPPDRLYRMKSTGQRVTLHSYSENNTVTVDISGEYNFLTFDRQVFGIDPDDLEECDIPSGELLGTMIVQDDDVEAFIDAVRPDVLASRGITSCGAHGDTPDADCKVCNALRR
jgi:hypothetical protein